jgi:hypothetical protein
MSIPPASVNDVERGALQPVTLLHDGIALWFAPVRDQLAQYRY